MLVLCVFFFFKQKTAYEMRISDWSSDVCSSDLPAPLDERLTARIQKLAVEAFKAVGCTGWSRVDFMIRESDSQPFLLEINTSPGMTSHSLEIGRASCRERVCQYV